MLNMLYYNVAMMLYRSIRAAGNSSNAWASWAAVGAVIAAALLATADSTRAEAPAVVASFKPVHSLVAAIMEGVGTPALIVKGAASPHNYALTPSDAQTIQDARIIFWIGEGLEIFLHKAIGRCPKAPARWNSRCPRTDCSASPRGRHLGRASA
jgi:hypothetical protein